MSTVTASRVPVIARLVGVVLISFALVALAVLPQLTARLTGEEFRLRVAPLDPIDPFRGAYVALAYPDIQDVDSFGNLQEPMDDGERGDVFVTLVPEGEVWVAGELTRDRPDDGPYLTCNDRDFRLNCGIDSWFLPQDNARELEDAVRNGTAIATVRIDNRGNAALIDVSVAD
jgi:uncharacterized membrane-anchored protein